MGLLSYDSAPLPVRSDLAEAHRRFWRRLARPGAWWTGVERVAIAAETRNARSCGLCRKRKSALSPKVIPGQHDHLGSLPPPAVEAIHRIVTDPGRLSRPWLDSTLAAGLAVEAYVELVGTVAAVISVDSFCRGIGVPPHELPAPEPGEPSRSRPPAAVADEAWVPMIPREGASGAEADLWPEGFVPNVARALSLVPDEVRSLKDLAAAHYLDVGRVADATATGGSLTRPQMELLAARVSVLNQCFY
jgi:hypothetical protein